MKNTKKFLAMIICLVIVSVSLVACGGPKTLSCTIDELFAKIEKKNAEGTLTAFDSDRLSEDLQLKSEYFSEGKFKIPFESAGVEAIGFFKASDDAKADKILLLLQKYINDVKVAQKDYNAGNYDVACKAIAVKEGLYVYLIMSPKVEDIKTVINENLK
ncbi:MAG: DUF4358 domain-containing protein [Clostridia bacterium]